MSSVVKQFSLTDLSNLYRIAYGDFELDAAGWDHSELIGLIQKSSKFVGNRLEMAQLVDWEEANLLVPCLRLRRLISIVLSSLLNQCMQLP